MKKKLNYEIKRQKKIIHSIKHIINSETSNDTKIRLCLIYINKSEKLISLIEKRQKLNEKI